MQIVTQDERGKEIGMKQISWHTPPVGRSNGYGYAAVESIKALQRAGIRVDWNEPRCNIHIDFVQPHAYTGNVHQYRIGYTPWESSEVPCGWVEKINKCNDFWTPSNYCKDVFENAGVEHDIKVVPHGIDPEIFTIEQRTLNDKFVFLHIGGPTERKGGQRVVDAFIQTFGGRDDVFLVIKAIEHTEARWYNGGQLDTVETHPQIGVITSEISESDLASLYHRAHCLVYPSRGEGFGFIPFQGMATGVPTIVTDASAMKDFSHFGIPLEASEVPCDGLDTFGGIHIGTWFEPSQERLCELMEDVVSNWGEYNKKAIQSAHIIHATQTWDHVAKQMIELIGEDKMFAFGERDHLL